MAKPLIFDIYARVTGEKDVNRLSNTMKVLGSAGALLALKFGKDSVKAFSEAEQAQTRLSDAFAKFPKLSNISIDSLRSYNTELSKKTRFDDDATASGQAVLAQFGLTGQQIRTLTPLLQDYAAKTGQDLPSAATALGKATLGQGRALKAIGINFKDTGSQAGNLETITAGLRRQVGGFAEKEGKTAAGQSAILSNQFGELEETAGSKLIPALVKLTGVGLTVVDFISRNQKVIVPLVAAFGALAVITWTVNKATVAWVAIQKVAAVATKVWAAGQWLLNAALTANPIGLVIVAVAAFVAGIIIAYKRSETFRKIVDGAFRAIAAAGSWMWNSVLKPAFAAIGAAFGWVGRTAQMLYSRVLLPTFRFISNAWLTVVGAIINGAAKALGWVPGIGPKLRAAAEAFNRFRNQVNDALSGIKNRSVTVTARASVLMGQGLSRSDAISTSLHRAAGGPIRGPGTTTSDSILAAVSNDEHVWSAREVAGAGGHARVAMLRKLAAAGQLPGFAAGGPVQFNVYARAEGMPRFRSDIGAVDRFATDLVTRAGTRIAKAGAARLSSAGAVGRTPGAVGGNAALGQRLVAALYGWTGAQWNALFNLWQGESGWNNNAQNPTSTAYGIPQFLNSTWASVGAVKTSDPGGQIRAGARYIRQRYRDPISAYGAWLSRSPHWYGKGLPPTVFRSPTLIGVGESGPETVSVIPRGRAAAGAGSVEVTLNFYGPVAGSVRQFARDLAPAIQEAISERLDRSGRKVLAREIR